MTSIGDAIKAARMAKQGFQTPNMPMAQHQQIAPPPQYMQMPPGPPQMNYMIPPPPPPPPTGPMSIADQIRAAKLAKSGAPPPPPPPPPSQQYMQQQPLMMQQTQMMQPQMMQAPPPPSGPAKPMSIADQIRQNRIAKQGPTEQAQQQQQQQMQLQQQQLQQQQFMQQQQYMQSQMVQPQAPQMPSLPSAIAEQLARQQAAPPQAPVNKNQSIADQIRAARLGNQAPKAVPAPQPTMQQYLPQQNIYAPPQQQQPQQQQTYAPPQQQYQQPVQQQFQQPVPQQQYQQPQFQQKQQQQQQFQQPPQQFQQQQQQLQPPQFQQQQFQQPQFQQQQMYQAPAQTQPQSNLPPALAAVLDVTAAHGIFSDSDLELFGDYIILYENKATELTVRKKMVADGFPPADITTFFKNYRAYKKNETVSNKGAAKGISLTPQQMQSMPGQENSVEAMAKYTKMKESSISEMLIRDTMAMDGYSKPEIDAFFEFEKKVKEEAAALAAAAKAAAAVAPKHHPPAAWMTPEAQAPVMQQQMPPWMQQQQQQQQQQNESPFSKAQNKFGKQQQPPMWQPPQAQDDQASPRGRPNAKKIEPSAAIKALFGNKDTKKDAKEQDTEALGVRSKKEKVGVSDAVAALFGSKSKGSTEDEDDKPIKAKKTMKKATKADDDDDDDDAQPRRKVAFDKEKFAKYVKMRDMKLPDGAIRQKMVMDGLSDKDQSVFFAWDGTDGDDDAPKTKSKTKKATKKIKLDVEKYGKYIKMQEMKLPEGAIRQKMVMDGLSDKEQNLFFDSNGNDEADGDDSGETDEEEEDVPAKKSKSKRTQADEDMYGRYFRMRKMNLPDDAIKAKMKVDGLSQGEMRRFFDGDVVEPEFSGAAAAKVIKAIKVKPAAAEVDEEEEVEVKKPKKLAASSAVASLFGGKAKNSDEAEEVEEKRPKKLAASNAVASLFGAKAKDSDEAEEVEVKKPKKLAASNAVAALFGAKKKSTDDDEEEEVEVKKPKKKISEEETETKHRSPDDEELFAKYIKMESMKLPEGAIRQKMVMDGLAARDQDRFFKGADAPSKTSAPVKTTTIRVQKQDLDDEYHLEDRFTKYANMQRNLSPEYAIRQKMTHDGLSNAEITRFFQSSKRASISTAHGDDQHDQRGSDASRHSVDHTDSRFLKFSKLHKTGTPEYVIRQKMSNDGFTNGEITGFFLSVKRASSSSNHSDEAAPSMRSSVTSTYANDEKYAKYVKMHKMMAAETNIRQRMTMDGFSSGDVSSFLTAMRKHSSHAAAEVETDRSSSFIDTQVDEKYSRYAKMQRMGSPEVAVRQKMILDGFGQPEINKFFAEFKDRMSMSTRESTRVDNHSRPQKIKVPDSVSSLFGSKQQDKDEDADERPQPKKIVRKPQVVDDDEDDTPASKPVKASKTPVDEKDKYINMLRDELDQDIIRQRMHADGFSDEDVDTFFEYSSYALSSNPKKTQASTEQVAKSSEPVVSKATDDDDSSEVSTFGFIRPRYRAGLLPPCEDTGVQLGHLGGDSAAPVRIIGNANTERRIVKKRGNSDELVITVVLPIQSRFPNPKYEKPKLLSDGIIGNPSDVTDSSEKESGIISPARLLLSSLKKLESSRAPKETGMWPYAAFKSTSRLSDNTEIDATFAALTDEFSADADHETSPFESTRITSRISIKARDADTETDAGTDIESAPSPTPETTHEEIPLDDGTQKVQFSAQILVEDEGTQAIRRSVIKPGVKKSAMKKSKAAVVSSEPPKNKFQKYSEMFDSGVPADQLRREMKNDGTPIELINQFFDAKVPMRFQMAPRAAVPIRRPQGDNFIKYRTMLKVNLPREVVQARMATDGFSPLEIMFFFRSLGPGYVDPYTRWLSQKALDSIPGPRNSLPSHIVHSPRALSQYPPDESADSRNAYFAKTLLDAEKKIRDVSMTKLSKKERQRRLDKERDGKKHDRLKVIHNSRVNGCYYVWGDAPVNVVPSNEELWTPTILSPTQARMRRSSSADALFGRVMGQLKIFSPNSPNNSRNGPYQPSKSRPREW